MSGWWWLIYFWLMRLLTGFHGKAKVNTFVFTCIHQQGSGKWVGVHVDARVKSDSWTCGIGITFLSHFIHTNTHLNCILIWFCSVSKVTYAGLVRQEVWCKQVFLLFHCDLLFIGIQIERFHVQIWLGWKHKHFCFVKDTTYLYKIKICMLALLMIVFKTWNL